MMVKNVFNIIRNNKGRFLIMLFLVAYLKLLDNGFCYQTGKFFSQLDQEELINRGIEKLLVKHKPQAWLTYGFEGIYRYNDPIIPYQSIEEFKALNPYCCSFRKELGKEWSSEHFLKKITGEVYGYVYLEYITRRANPNNLPQELKSQYPPVVDSVTVFPIDNCGNLKESKHW